MKIESTLQDLSKDFFRASKLSADEKKVIFSRIVADIEKQKTKLVELIMEEVKFTEHDAIKEVARAYETFKKASQYASLDLETSRTIDDKVVYERRIARGPLLAITPFSSPLSSPAHKISMAILAGTSVLFKPSPLAIQTGRFLAEIIRAACDDWLVQLLDEHVESFLDEIIADERIGVVSFTGSYETGQKIIQKGGVKRYHMELSGGNSLVLFSPLFQQYSNLLIDQLVDGIVAKNGQRCVSIKHIFIPYAEQAFVNSLIDKLTTVKKSAKNNQSTLGPLISSEYASEMARKIVEITSMIDGKSLEAIMPFERKGAFVFPTAYQLKQIDPSFIHSILEYDLSGPIVFIHSYANTKEYEDILSTLKNDYIRSGIQLSAYVDDRSEAEVIRQDLYWGGILFNTLPTFRHDTVSFGGFGRAGLGKEGFFETINMYTDPQTIVLPKTFMKT
jgi:acyl-CoA reductase-like NAD-dependent aldehyde dehydrogenase